MRKILLFIIFLCFLIYPVFSYTQNHTSINSNKGQKDWSQVQKVFGRKGIQQGDVLRINFLRKDAAKVNGMKVDPHLVLGGFASFTPMHDHTMLMCTMVLLENEVEPVIEKLIANNIEVMSIHNHLLNENPRIIFLHCMGHGDAVKLAKGYKDALSVTKTPLEHQASPAKSNFDWHNVEAIIGFDGKKHGDLIMFSIPRADKIYEMDTELVPLAGVGQSLMIQKIGSKLVSIGDFVVTPEEVNPVLKALTKNGIKVTSIHNHMLDENPRTYCLHYWAYDTPEKVAKGLRAALDKVNIVTASK